jgi:hypothetical protein
MNDVTLRILTVAAVGPSALRIKWRGRRSDQADLSGWIATGGNILAPLRDPALFSRARVGDYGASVAWGKGDDLRIDAVHLDLIAAEQRPFDATDAAEWQHDMTLSNSEAADLLGISPSTWAAYKAGATIPSAICRLCRAARRDPILMQAHYRPRRAGRPRKSA